MRLALRLLIFPTTWFAGLLLIDFLFTHFRSTPGISEETTFFSAFFVFAIAVAWGAVCLVVAQFALRDPGTKTRSLVWPLELVALIISVVLGPLIAAGSTSAFTYDPIGVGNDTGAPPCVPTDVTRPADDRGPVATIREVHCVGDWDEPSTYFVFVHEITNAPDRQDLVLRYRGGWEGAQWGEAPNVVWINNASLRIKGGGKIEQITAQQSRAHGVDIEYALTPPVCPPVYNSLERLLWNWFRWFTLCGWMG